MNKKKLPRAIAPQAANLTGKSFAVESEPATMRDADDTAAGPTGGAVTAPPTPENREPENTGADGALAARRQAAAMKLARRFSIWSGIASAIPVPFVDLAAIGSVQIQMLRRISQIYNVPFCQNRGKALIAGLAGALIPGTSALGAASIAKGAPLVGTAVSTVAMPALSIGATYAIGLAFIRHFASGGTLLDFRPPDYHEFIKAQSSLHHKSS